MTRPHEKASFDTTKLRFRKFLRFIGPKLTRLFCFSIVSGLFLFAAESAFIFVLQGFLIAIGIAPRTAFHLPAWYPENLAAALSLLVLVGFLRALGYFLKNFLESRVIQTFYRIQRERIITYSLDYAAEISTHEAISAFSETTVAAGAALSNIASLLLTGTAGLFFFSLGLRLAPREMILGCFVLGAFGLLFKKIDNYIKASGEEFTKEWMRLSATLLAGIRNNFFLKVHGLIDAEKAKAFSSLERYQKTITKFQTTAGIKMAVPPFLGVLVVSLLSYIGLKHFHTPAGVLISFFYIFTRCLQTTSELAVGIGGIRFNLPSIKLLHGWQLRLDAKVKNTKPPRVLTSDESRLFQDAMESGGIEIKATGLSFRYDESDTWLFEDLQLNVRKGDCLVIMGESGSGKSTLLSILLGINKPKAGTLTVNGTDVEPVRTLLFNDLGYIGPEPYLVPGTVLENLLYGHPDASNVSQNQVWEALTMAKADDFVAALPQQERTFLNETAKISTGQKQRLAIARALLRRPKLLVMDECTSNLDYESEAEIVGVLRKLIPTMTTIIVTHRPAFKEVATQRVGLGGNPLC